MDLKKIAIQLFKADKARKMLNKNQLIDLSICFDVISNNVLTQKYVPFDLDQLESVFLDTCDITVNADLLHLFVNLGKQMQIYHSNENDLLIAVNVASVKKDISLYSCFRLIDLSKNYSNYGFQYFQSFFSDVLKFDLRHGIDAANIPQWILDIPVTEDDLKTVNQTLVNFVYLKFDEALYTLEKSTADHKNVYYFKKYTKDHGEFYVTLNSTQRGLISRHCGTNSVKRCKDLTKQMEEIIVAFECEQDRQKAIAEQARKEHESKTA